MFEHWGNAIYWNQFSWEAFAALLAVLGAISVGWRQVGIQRKQVEIANLEVKAAVWKERLQVYDATRNYLAHIVTRGAVPGRLTLAASTRGGDVSAPEVAVAFMDALDRSQFLFQPAVRGRLEDLWRTAEELADIRGSADVLYEPTKTPAETRASVLRNKLVDQHAAVAAIFGDELMLRP